MNKTFLASAICMAIALAGCEGDTGPVGPTGATGPAGPDGEDLTAAPALIRLATTAVGSEITGMEKTDNGEFFFNVQHPNSSLPNNEGLAAVGAWVGADVDNLDVRMTGVPVPATGSPESETTVVAVGSYQILGREGDTYAGGLPFGLGAIVDGAGMASIKISPNPDFNGFIPADASGSSGYLFTAWEDRPAAVSRLQLTRLTDGSWMVDSAMNLDFSAVNGVIILCFGSVSPWGTPLVSEENYEAENTVRWNDVTYSGGYPNYADVQNVQTYLGGTYPNPYDYGYIVEIADPTSAAPAPVKHFTLGRVAHENAVIMPDGKTVYITDDGSNKGFYKFIADNPADLSSGTLYAAKVTQDATSDAAKAGFDIEWLEMASATNAEIEAWIDEYDGIDETNYVDGSTSYISDAEVADWAAGTAADDRVAFLETLRGAAAIGATVEWNKMEGIAINYDGAASGAVPFMYVAMSDVTGAMTDGAGDIQIAANRCGIVYRFGLDADYNASRMDPVVVGGPYDSTAAENQCAVDGIASPDNVTVLDDGRVLIGEDTSRHVNNMLWMYNPAAR